MPNCMSWDQLVIITAPYIMSSDSSVEREGHPLLHPEEEDPSVQRERSSYPGSPKSDEEPAEVITQ